MTGPSDQTKPLSESAEGAPQGPPRDWRLVSSNIALGASLMGIPWTYVQPTGRGLTLSFACLVVALLLRSSRPKQ